MAERELRRLRSCALAIICGKPEEMSVIAEKMGAVDKINGHAVDGVDNGHLFYLGTMEFPNEKTLKFYVTSSLSQGLVPFAISAGALISVLRPRFAIHAGVCAGNKNKGVKLMQVICGDSSMSLEDGKFGFKNGEITFMPDYETIRSPVAGLEEFARKKPNVHFGRFISAAAVREDAPAIFEKIETNVSRNVIALEMESSAFLKLCLHSHHTGVSSLGVIKGVSDLGDADKGKDPAVYRSALEKTGEALESWVRNYFENTTWERSEANEQGAKLAEGYYKNFVQRVVDAVSGAIPDDHIVGLPMGEKAGTKLSLKVVMPPENNVDFFAEQGQIEGIVEAHDLHLVTVGRTGYQRTAYWKNGALIDFPRTLNSLCDFDESQHQAAIFKRYLERRPYFLKGAKKEASAQLLTWEEFETFMI